MRSYIVIFVALVSLALSVSSCGNKEQDALAQAQQCLDKVPQSSPTQADQCLGYIAQYSSPSADKLKCSIYLTSGGLVENKVVQAYNVLKDNTQTNKEASYMAILSLDLPDVDTAYTKAVQANDLCKASQDKGLIYISSIVLAGTYMNKTIKAITGSALDISNASSVNSAVQTLLNSCTSNPPAASCTTDISTLGATAVTVASTYCGNATADASVCANVNSAVSSAGGNTANVGQALFCYLKNMKYDSASNTCTP